MFWTIDSLIAIRRRELLLTAALLLCVLMVLLAPAHAQSYSVIYNFGGGNDGGYPLSGLTLAGTSRFYGGDGDAIFMLRKMGTNWTLLPIFEFNGTNGTGIWGRLTIGPDGTLYGASLETVRETATSSRLTAPKANLCACPLHAAASKYRKIKAVRFLNWPL